MSESASETKVGRERSRRGWVNTEQVGIGKQMTNEKMHNEVGEKSWRQKYSNKRQILFFHLTKDQYKQAIRQLSVLSIIDYRRFGLSIID